MRDTEPVAKGSGLFLLEERGMLYVLEESPTKSKMCIRDSHNDAAVVHQSETRRS